MSVDHYENFPVASFLCPPALRPTVAAIYHFARTADDIADEGDAPSWQRLEALQAYRGDLSALFSGAVPSGRWPGVFAALGRARQAHQLPEAPLADLLDAFQQDVGNPRYDTREALLDYCRRSANPVGRLLLHLYRIDDPALLQASDDVCTALQLINFWQDLSVDLPRGRCYLPLEDAQRHGVTLEPALPQRDTAATRALVASLCGWARGLMLQGAPLALRIPGRAGWELRGVVQGGLRVLDTIARMEHGTITRRPTLGWQDLPAIGWRMLRMGLR